MVTTRSATRTRTEQYGKPKVEKRIVVQRRRASQPKISRELAIEQVTLVSTRIDNNRPATIAQPPGLIFQLQPAVFGLIQERIRESLYALVVQAILWNQTRGLSARPVLFSLLALYPTPEDLAKASHAALSALLQPIGLHNTRAARLIALAQAWVAAPPCKERRYRKLHYPFRGAGSDVKPDEVLGPNDKRVGYEIAHLPGMGPYAIDSYRIFYRDRLRGIDEGTDPAPPEWQSVDPDDKDLKAYMKWRWSVEESNRFQQVDAN